MTGRRGSGAGADAGGVQRTRGRPASAIAALALGLSALGAAVPAAAEVRSVAVHAPRTFGYFIGDRIPVTIEILADPGDRLDPASLPRPGPLDYWLDLTSVDVEEGDGPAGARRITVRLGLQAFYAALEPRALDVPPFTFGLTGPDGASVARAPSWPVIVSPLREIMPRDGDDPTRIRPDASPVFRSARLAGAGVVGFALLSIAGLVAVAANRAWWPFHRRPARPFTRAVRDLARLGHGDDSGAVRAVFLVLHRAFDAAAGRRLLADDLGGFFVRRPDLAPAAAEATNFFARSRSLFFAEEARAEGTPADVAAVRALARRLAAAERRAP